MLTLFVPAEGSHLRRTIDPGSAIVGEAAGLRTSIYYEGNRFGFMKDFNEMVLHAADRLVCSYPTIARAWVEPNELVPVGYVDRATRKITEVTDDDALRAWRSEAR